MAKQSKKENPFVGRWHIVSMSAWEDDCLNEEVQAFIEFDAGGRGALHFGYVQGQFDYRTKKRDGQRAAQFCWDGEDGADDTPLEGIGWANLEGDRLSGMICIHLGDDLEFVAKKAKEKKATKRK